MTAGQTLMTLPEPAARRAPVAPAQDPRPAQSRAGAPQPFLPLCALCHRPVDKVTWCAQSDAPDMVYEAHCHGAVEQLLIPRRAALNGDAPGTAFLQTGAHSRG